jgi:hypothetical protein
MCLEVLEEHAVKNAKAAAKIMSREKIVAFKIVEVYEYTDEQHTRVLTTQYQGRDIVPGEFKSNRPKYTKSRLHPNLKGIVFKPLARHERFSCGEAEVFKGIHVYLYRRDAEEEIDRTSNGDNRLAILPVTCNSADLVAVGVFDDDRAAVFTKVFVKEEDYEKAITTPSKPSRRVKG